MTETNDFAIDPQPKPRGRPKRSDEVKAERRRREDLGPGRHMKLTVRGKKDPNYEYRWINNNPGRVHQLTQEDDWDVVTDAEADNRNVGVGTAAERVVDKGTGDKAILVRKRKEYYDQDKAKEAELLERAEASMRAGIAPDPNGLKRSDNMYVPEGGIRFDADR